MFVADVSRLTPSSISIPVLSTLARWSVQPLHTKVLLTLTMLLFIPLHFLCTHFWQLVHCTEFLSTPLPQTLHGHLPVLCSPMWLFPQIITLVLFIFTFTPVLCTPSFHLLSFVWPPYVIGQAIIFLPYGFFLLLLLFSSPNLSGRRLDVYHMV